MARYSKLSFYFYIQHQKSEHRTTECRIKKENINTDKEWEQLKLHFEEVNPGFFNNLQGKYPQLTQNELTLCAYYRINLGTKEIAKILNATPSAIQTCIIHKLPEALK